MSPPITASENETGGLQLSLRPENVTGQISSGRVSRKTLNKYSLLLAPGLLGSLFALIKYLPLDASPFVAFGLCALAIPTLLPGFRRFSGDLRRVRLAYVWSSVALVLLAILLLLNGWLDKSPRNFVRTTVIQKRISRSRSGTEHWITVASWRPGRTSEDFLVSSYEFTRVRPARRYIPIQNLYDRRHEIRHDCQDCQMNDGTLRRRNEIP